MRSVKQLAIGAFGLCLFTMCGQAARAVDINPIFDPGVNSARRAMAEAAAAWWEDKLSSKQGKVRIEFSWGPITTAVAEDGGSELLWPSDPSIRTTGPLGVTTDFTEAPNAQGLLKPTFARIRINTKYTWWEGRDLPPDGTWPDPDSYDLWSVLKHEIAHAIGFTVNYTKFRNNVSFDDMGMRHYNLGGFPTAKLTGPAAGTHTDPTAHPGDLMNPEIGTCIRQDDKALTAMILNHGVWDPFKPTPGTAMIFVSAGVLAMRRKRESA